MRALLRKPQFWACLAACSLVTNLSLGFVAMHAQLTDVAGDDPLWAQLRRSTSAARLRVVAAQYFDRLLRRRRQLSDGCRTGGGKAASTLPHDGFWTELRRSVESDDGRNSSGYAATKTSAEQAATCSAPPRSTCRTERYSVVVTTSARHGNDSLRRLFVNLMTLRTYPSVLDVTVITLRTAPLQRDSVYGRRLLTWGREQPGVTVLELDSLWSLPSTLQERIRSEAVVWLDGDQPKTWNARSLKQALYFWRQRSDAFWMTETVKIRPQHDDAFCPVPQLHLSVFHRDLLCYLRHPVSTAVRNVTRGTELERYAVSLLLSQISSRIMINDQAVYPTPARSPLLSSTNTDDDDDDDHRTLSELMHYFGCCTRSSLSVAATGYGRDSTALEEDSTTECDG